MEAVLTSWSPLQKAAFRFCFIYFSVYCFPFPLDATTLTEPLVKPYFTMLDFIITKIGTHILQVPARVSYPGFDKVDDSYYGVTFLVSNFVLSFVGAVAWTLLDRRRANYVRLYDWLHLYLRFFLSAYLIGYGFSKVFPSQFQEVTASRLVMEVGEQTPMMLAWNFMGFSAAFSMISGAIEIVAGILLFFRRTATLGALLASMTFSFIALLDFCFNVPIKLLVSHLLLISILLLLSDGKRLVSVLVLNKSVAARTYRPFFRNENWRKGFVIFQLLLIAGLLYKSIFDSLRDARQWGRYAPRVPHYGIYQTYLFIRNNDTIPPLETDSLRWKQLVIDGGSWKQQGVIKFNNDQKVFYNIQLDTVKGTLRIENLSDTMNVYTLRYVELTKDRMLLKGKWKGDSIQVFLTKRNMDSIPLLSDRFRLVEE